ncbi:putative glycolipid-binding domain-containing protein [Kribbella sp. NPDC051586]|uniref:putative glycolipid-binding domain-containing protein n=1 Tax=Kribbella sp. NPDC051586 TaxID=3364118 RepID=UPI0037B00F7B
MQLKSMPRAASWTHGGVRTGFEVLFVDGHRLRGRTSAREGPSTWFVGYEIDVDEDWLTRTVHAAGSTASGDREVALERGADGRWSVDGSARPDLDGCLDVDFESSAVTNTLPIHRLPFVVGETLEVPAAFVQADDLSVIRIEQRYTLLSSDEQRHVFGYESATFDFACDLTYDASGLVLDYPGIATRDS